MKTEDEIHDRMELLVKILKKTTDTKKVLAVSAALRELEWIVER
jgi:hypothetical protein